MKTHLDTASSFIVGLIFGIGLIFAGMTDPSKVIGFLDIAGLLVGIGTRYGGGCTSGHGICGLSRLSPRSLIATLAFMGSGMAIVFAMRHLLIHA